MALPSIKNSVGMAVTAVADSGVGTITLGAALSGGYQTAATAYGANANIDIRIEEGNTWEVCRDCTYTHSGTTVSRGTLEASSTGSAISFTSAAKVYVVETAERIRRETIASQAIIPGGRLTLESGVPVSTTDQTAKTTIYYTPYIHNIIPLWDGAAWVPTVFAEKSMALGTVTAALCYDVFGYLNAGELVIEKLAWTSATARATGISLQDGRYCKTGDKTRLYLGTFYTDSTTTTCDTIGGTTSQTGGKRFLWNLYNQVLKSLKVIDTTNSWTYDTATWRAANNSAGNRVEFVCGLPSNARSNLIQSASSTQPGFGYVGIGLDTTTASSCPASIGYIGGAALTSTDFMMPVFFTNTVSVGYHYLSWNERGGGATFTRYGDNGETGLRQSNLSAEVNL